MELSKIYWQLIINRCKQSTRSFLIDYHNHQHSVMDVEMQNPDKDESADSADSGDQSFSVEIISNTPKEPFEKGFECEPDSRCLKLKRLFQPCWARTCNLVSLIYQLIGYCCCYTVNCFMKGLD